MYVRYINYSAMSKIDVRNVEHFSIQVSCVTSDDGNEVEEAVICDGSLFVMADYGKHLVDILLGRPVPNAFMDCADLNGSLAYFSSLSAAQRVLGDICRALDAGKTFFDLTQYDAQGNLISHS